MVEVKEISEQVKDSMERDEQYAKKQDQVEIRKREEALKKVKSKPFKYIRYSDIHQEDKDKEEGSGGIGDFYQLLAMLIGGMCYVYKVKIAAWLCLYLIFCSIINMRFENMMQQGSTSLGLVMVAFVQCYIAPDHEYMKKMQREREIKANPEKLLSEK